MTTGEEPRVVSRGALPPLAEMFALPGKTAIVTGAGRGVGSGIARVLAQAGASVALAARSEDEIEEVAGLIRADGGNAIAVPTDVAEEESLAALVERTKSEFGGIDVVVNNAGMNRFLVPTEQIRLSGLDKVIAVNLRGPYVLCQLAGMEMIAQGHGGAIVNVLTTAARRGLPTHGPYSAAKAGLMRFSESLALEWARHGIRVNCVGPGAVQTDMSRRAWGTPEALEALTATIPVGRVGQPEDIAYAVLYLASPAAAYVTAQTLWVDGGSL